MGQMYLRFHLRSLSFLAGVWVGKAGHGQPFSCGHDSILISLFSFYLIDLDLLYFFLYISPRMCGSSGILYDALKEGV